jgi:hypothetical protein
MAGNSEERKQLKAEVAAKKAEAKALRPWYKKKRFIIPSGFLILTVLSSLGSGNSNTNSSGTSAAKTSESISKIGQEARDGKFAFTINSVKCGVKNIGSYYFSTKPQGRFCVLDVLVKNIGDQAQSVSSSNMYLYDQDSRKFSTSNEAMIYLPNSDLWYRDINPGNFVKGQLVFDLPVGVSPVKAELHDSAFSNGVVVALE